MILTQPLLLAQERLDLEDMNVLFESILADSKYQTKQFWSGAQYVFKGFAVSGLGAASPATVDLTDATLINANNSGNFSWYTAPIGAAAITVPLNANVRNYLELQLTTESGTPLTKAFWDPSAQGGLGSEFNQTVNTAKSIAIKVNVLTGGFSGSTDAIPLAIVDTDGSNNVKLILDKRPLFYRLGTPTNPLASYSWVTRAEPPITLNLTGITGTFVAGEIVTIGSATATVVTGGTAQITVILPSSDSIFSGNSVTGGTSGATGTLSTVSASFTGADKSVGSIREMFSAFASEIKALKGTQFWFSSAIGSTVGLMNFINSLISPVSAGAAVSWNGTSLKLTNSSLSPSSADVIAKIRIFGTSQQLSLQRQDGTGGSTALAVGDGQVLFVQLPATGNRSYSGAGSGATNYQTAAMAAFVPSDSNYWLAYREGSQIFFRGTGELQINEDTPIGDTIPASLLDNLGLVDVVTPAAYSSNIRGTANESLVSRIGVNTDSIGDEQEDRSGYIRSDTPVLWDGTTLTFTSNIILEFLNTKTGAITQHTVSSSASPLTIPNGESIWVAINRSSTSETVTAMHSLSNAIPAQTQANKDVFILFKRIDVSGAAYLHLPFMKQLMGPGQSVRLGQAGGGGSGNVKATFYDVTSTTLPTGTSVTIDGVLGTNGDTVLYANLSSGNNEIYTLSGVGTSIAWTAARNFNGALTPTLGDTVIILKGNSFANQIGEFNGTTFKFNDVVRYFSGTDYWEQTSLKTTALANNTTANIFSVTALGSENIIMDYSVIRGGKKETGSIYLVQDGLGGVALSIAGGYIGATGVSFAAAISSGVLTLSYTSDAAGSTGTLKYTLKRWADAPGGPAGVPSYSGGSSVATGAAGSTLAIQYNGGSGTFAADNRFQFNAGTNAVILNGLNQELLSSAIVLNDNVNTPTTLTSFDQNLFPFIVLEYSVRRNTDTQVGRMLITNNGSAVSLEDDSTFTNATGITFTATLSGGQVLLQYISTSTGSSAVFKYASRKWA